jgi:alkylation response protein AidB-like acyl-CoA dehydrogenase
MMQELQEIRSLAREFAAAELRPHSERWDAERRLDPDLVGKLAELGFFGMLIPEADGGMGFDTAVYAAALEELAWGEPAVALLVAHSVLAADLIARHGNDEQRARWLGGMAAGEIIGCIAFAEDGHPPLDALNTRAERDGDGWRLRGRKRWVSNGAAADVVVVLASTPDGPALFAVPREHATPGAAAQTLGLRALPLVDLELDADLGADALLGTAAGDPREDDDALGRTSAAAIAVGIAQAALDHAVGYAAVREQFGRPIRSFDGIRDKLVDMALRTTAARALLERAAAAPHDAAAAAMAKLAAADCAMHVTTEAVQVYGGYGYMRDYPVEKLMRDAKATQIMHGSSDALRARIAEALYS